MSSENSRPLLPSNANAYERALSLAVAFGDDILPEDIKTLWRPQEAAARFLPFIAWGLHVDFWRDTLPEQVKRDLISGAYEWHRIEGTFGAIRRICDAVFGETQVQAWFEYGGEPYGFRVLTDGKLSGPEDWAALREAIWFAQALRDSLDVVEISRELSTHLYCGMRMIKSGQKQIGLPSPKPRQSRIYAGCAISKAGAKRIGLHHREQLRQKLEVGNVMMKSGTKTIGLSKAGREMAEVLFA
jgi:phage tail protein, P2 protein I family